MTSGPRLRNWGRWGDDDERGTLNLITPERLVAAGGLIRQGKIFDLGIPFDEAGPQPGGGRINPVHLMSQTGDTQMFPGGFKYADDYIFMPLQGATQWDSLAHVYYDDHLYNGFPASDVTVVGAFHDTIDKIAKGVAGRGVLLDIARLKGVDWLEHGYVITPDDLEAAIAAQGGVEPSARATSSSSAPAGGGCSSSTGRRRSSWPASPAWARTAASGCTPATSPRCAPTTGPSRCCRARTPTPSSTCTWS